MRLFLIISQVIYVLAVLPWFAVIVMTPMVFDSGFSVWGISFVLTLGIYPLAVIVCSILSWILYRNRKAATWYVNLIPCLWFVGAAVFALVVQ